MIPRSFLRTVLLAALVVPVVPLILLGGCGSGDRDAGLCPAFDFVAGLPQAEVRAETRSLDLGLDLGTEKARKDLLAGWSVDETWNGGPTSFVWGVGPVSSLRVFRLTALPARLRFRCRPLVWPAAPPQVVTTFVNGIRVGETRLAPEDFATYEVAIPGTAFVSGENTIEFRYSRHGFPPGALGSVAETRPLAVAWDGLSLRDADDVKEAAEKRSPSSSSSARLLELRSRTRLDYFVPVSPGSRLRLGGVQAWGSGSATSAAGSANTARLEVQIQGGDGAGETRSYEIEPSPLAGTPVEVDLPPRGFPVARISFLVRSPHPAAADPGGLSLVQPELWNRQACGARREPPPVRQARPGRPGRPEAPREKRTTAGTRPNLLVYLVDTLRADHLGVYGSPRPVSPEIDRLARDGVVFTQAFAQSGWTRSSVTSILTGLTPLVHRVLQRSDALPASLPTLQGLLHGAGYETLGIVTNPTVSTDFGFARSFDRFLPLDREQASGGLPPTADRVSDEFLAWLHARKSTAPFFAYLHTMDPHDPYTPREPYRSRFAPRPRTGLDTPRHEAMLAALARHPGLSEVDLKGDLEGLYDGEIAFNDAELGRLLAGLKQAGLYENTLIVFVSDHGEEFHDHGFWGHGHSLYREILHVPLILKLPGRSPGTPGRKLDLPVQHIDLLPTLLAAASVQPPPGLDGKNLLPIISGNAGNEGNEGSERSEGTAGRGDDRPLFSYLRLDAYDLVSLVSGGRHLVSRTPGHPEAQLEIYDLASDPRELHDVTAKETLWTGRLLGLLRAEWNRPLRGTEAPTVRIPKETEDRLRALGYVR